MNGSLFGILSPNYDKYHSLLHGAGTSSLDGWRSWLQGFRKGFQERFEIICMNWLAPIHLASILEGVT